MKRQDIKRRPLSDTALASLEPEGAVYREHDGGGLYFRVKPNGQKSWELRYKKNDGKWSWLGLGGYPEIGGSLARQRALELKSDASSGKSPIVSQQARKVAARLLSSSTFEILAREWFEARRKSWETTTALKTIGALELHVFPVFGKRPYTDISPMEWMEFLRGMELLGIFDQTSKVRRYCLEIYDLARVTGRAKYNPIEGLHRFLQTKRVENFAHVSADELPALLRAITAYPHAHDIRLGLRLLALTAVRPSELREASWHEFNLENALWSIPAERMKKRRDHLVPLSRQSVEILKKLQILNGFSSLLFPGRNDRTKPRSDMAFNMALRRIGYGGRQTGHGFRHIASTTLRENNFPREHVEAQLAHVEGGVAGVYNKAIYLDQRMQMMQWYADHLDKLERGNIVALNFKAQG